MCGFLDFGDDGEATKQASSKMAGYLDRRRSIIRIIGADSLYIRIALISVLFRLPSYGCKSTVR